MAHLFILESNRAKPNVETLLISPFKEIWDRDSSLNKDLAIKEFSYIEFMSSMKKSNPFNGYGEDIRAEKIVENLGMPKGWVADELVISGIDFINRVNSEGNPFYLAYMDSLESLNKTRAFTKTIDLTERNKMGMPVYKPSDVYSAIEKVENAVLKVNSLKEKVEQHAFDSAKTRGNKVINPLEV